MKETKDKEALLKELRELHDAVKMHPYWKTFDHGMYRTDICPAYRRMMDIVSDLTYHTDFENEYLLPMFRHLYHDFNAMLSCIYDTKNTDSDSIKMYWIPTLQAYLQLVHLLIDNCQTPENVSMILPNKVSKPTGFIVCIMNYKENWVNDDGYVISSRHGWQPVVKIRESEIDHYKNLLNKSINEYSKKTDRISKHLVEWFQVCIKDIDDRTGFVYKVV